MARLEMNSLELVGLKAETGDVDALFELGMKYSIGAEVEYDLITAHKWFSLAAMRGNELAREYRTEIAGEMSRTELRQAQQAARNWLQKN